MADRFGNQTLPLKLALLLIGAPLAFWILALVSVYVVKGGSAVVFLLGAASFSVFTGAGKFVVLLGISPDAPIGPLGLSLLVVAMDTAAAFMLIPIVPFVYRMPYLGKYLRQVQHASYLVLRRNRWMRRFTYGGLIGYVAVPFGGTGAVGAVFLGRLLGLGRVAIVSGTFAGAIIGATLILGVARLGQEHIEALQHSRLLTIGGIAVAILAASVILWRVITLAIKARQVANQRKASQEIPIAASTIVQKEETCTDAGPSTSGEKTVRVVEDKAAP